MAQLTWDSVGERFFEVGIDKGVLYVDGIGYAWNGLISFDENPSGGEPENYYQDGIPYIAESAKEEFKGKLTAYTYPNAFEQCDGSHEIAQGLYITQQNRKEFGLTYRTLVGNDIDETEHGYKLHILYNAMAGPSSKAFNSMSDSDEPLAFSWGISTRPVIFEDAAFGFRYGAHLVLDSREVYPWAMTAVENVLYGTETEDPRLPTPAELLALFIDNAVLKITDNGDGTWTAEGPDSVVSMFDTEIFQIDWPSAVMLDADTYTVSTF